MLASSWVSNLGDGIVLDAGPLLVASQTDEPFLVALASILQQLPWLLFGLYAGVIADRLNRRRIIVVTNVARAIVLALLATTIMTGVISVPVVLAAMFLLGTSETFADTTTSTLLPMLVRSDDLGVGNARLRFGHITLNRLVAPPVGALLFATGMALPFLTEAVLLGVAAVLIVRIGATPPAQIEASGSVRRDIVVGLRWTWSHPAIRTLVLTILAFNVTFGATLAIMVLYARERLGLGEFGFGLFATFGAAGGILGALGYSWLERHLGRSGIMRLGLIIETLTHLVLAVTTVPAIAFATFFVFGVHESAWGTTASAIRQRAVPNELQGRVGSVYMVSVLGSLVVGGAVGGVIAGVWGITAPFWFGFVGSALILATMWRTFARLAE